MQGEFNLMREEIMFLAEETPEGGFVASAIGYQIVVEANTFEDLKNTVHKAVISFFKQPPYPRIIRLNICKEELIQV